MHNKAIRCALIVLLLGSTPISSIAKPLSAEDVLKQFLKLDYEGYGLSSKGSKKLFPLTTWIDGPGWDACVVVKGYKIGKSTKKGSNIFIPVAYDVLGMAGGGVEWIPYTKKDRSEYFKNQVNVTYELTQVNGEWKIDKPQIYPHISLDVAVKIHERHLPGPADEPKMQQDMKRVVDSLRKLRGDK